MPMTTYGPAFRWFAWRPVDTEDRGWRWGRMVWRRRSYTSHFAFPAMRFWDHSVQPWNET